MLPLSVNIFYHYNQRGVIMKKIVLFGDSIFNGYENRHDTSRVTDVLNRALNNKYEIDNISMSGATTIEALDFINKRLDRNADLVILWYGTNDAANDWGIPLDNYKDNLQKLISIIGSQKMILIGPSSPDFNNPTEGSYYNLDRYRQYDIVAKDLAEQNKIPFLNMLNKMQKQGNVKPLLLNDGIHYSDQGIEFLVKNLVPLIKQYFKLE